MRRYSQLLIKGTAAVMVLVLCFGVLPLSARAWASPDFRVDGCGAALLLAVHPARAESDMLATQFNPEFTKEVVLPTGSLGLPGEPIVWLLTITNTGLGAGEDLVITDTLRDELQIDDVTATRGTVTVNDQTVVVTVPELVPAASMQVRIYTTVRRGPPSGVLLNQALLEGSGPGGTVSRIAVAEVFVPSGLPATGYPLVGERHGEGEPSLTQLWLGAMLAVALTAYFVYRRGRRW